MRGGGDGGVAVDGQMGVDGVQIGRVEGEAPHLAHAHAVEGHRRPRAQTRRRALETHDEFAAPAQAALVLDPQGEAQPRKPREQGEEADDDIADARLHEGSYANCAALPRSPLK